MSERRGAALAILSRVTYLRIVLVPAVMALVLLGPRIRYAFVAGATLFAVAAATDFLDGYLARRWGVSTTMGSFLDTTADKLLVSGVAIALVGVGRASPWAVAIIVGRELAVMGLRGAAAADGTVVKPSFWGKAKANVQFAAVFLAIVRVPRPLGPLFLDEWAMWAAAAITVVSGIEYFVRFSSVLKGGPPQRPRG